MKHEARSSKSRPQILPNVSILGDSRVFDTYYTGDDYAVRYGYDSTFPHLWRKAVLTNSQPTYDVVHIPDHFRGGTVQNNIVRLALTNPAVVVVVDGIWETLINKRHFLDYVERKLRGAGSKIGAELTFDFSARKLVDLFVENELSVSPRAFAERARRLVSYFRRRRREVVWLTLPVVPKRYVGTTFHAGGYRPIENWDECLAAMNEAALPVMEAYGCEVVDLTELMASFGGPDRALIDQWHFSPEFHAHLAEVLDERCCGLVERAPAPDHVSHRYMLGRGDAEIEEHVFVHRSDVGDEARLLAELPPTDILVYAAEIETIDNPRGHDRAEFERQADR